jgi:hypothetical protein
MMTLTTEAATCSAPPASSRGFQSPSVLFPTASYFSINKGLRQRLALESINKCSCELVLQVSNCINCPLVPESPSQADPRTRRMHVFLALSNQSVKREPKQRRRLQVLAQILDLLHNREWSPIDGVNIAHVSLRRFLYMSLRRF